MTSDTSAGALAQVSRLLTLVPLLHRRDAVRLDEAADLLGVPVAQVRKDLNVLFMCGTPGGYPDDLIDVDVEALEESDGVIRVSNADYLARPLRLTPVEASALLVALRVLRDGADAGTAEVVERTIAKLEVAATGAGADRVAVDRDDAGTDGLRRQLEAAVAEGRQVELTYHVPARDEDTERVVDPHGLVEVSGATYLHGWCHRAEAFRFFRLDRIRSATTLDSAVATEPTAVPDLSGGFFGSDPTAREVTLRLAPEASWVPEYYEVGSVRRLDDGHLDVVLRVGDPRWLDRLLLRLAPYARVLAPAEEAEKFIAAARGVLSLYE